MSLVLKEQGLREPKTPPYEDVQGTLSITLTPLTANSSLLQWMH